MSDVEDARIGVELAVSAVLDADAMLHRDAEPFASLLHQRMTRELRQQATRHDLVMLEDTVTTDAPIYTPVGDGIITWRAVGAPAG